jgi:hypothetical protein
MKHGLVCIESEVFEPLCDGQDDGMEVVEDTEGEDNEDDGMNVVLVNDTNESITEGAKTVSAQLDLIMIASKFVSKIKAKANVPISSLQTIMECTSEMFAEIVEELRDRTKNVIKDLASNRCNDEDIQDLMDSFDECCTPFSGLETGYMQNKYFLNLGTYIPPVSIPLGVAFDPQPDTLSGVVRHRQKHDTFEYVPIKELLKEILNSNLQDRIEDYRTQHRDPGILEDFIDGEFCKLHQCLSPSDPQLNILLYFDELETTNPLRTNGVHKLGMFYFTLKDIHPVLQSCLKNIFLLAVALSKDIKHYGFDAILNPILVDLKALESEGLLLDKEDGTTTRIRVVLCQTTGDNLGLHGLLGFAEGFTANFPCRRCSITREDAQQSTKEDQALIRTKTTYERDLAVDNVSETGVKRNCALNELQYFHVIENYVFDIMHDMLEGVCMIEVKLVLKAIIGQGLLSLDLVNERLTSFDYGFPEAKNRPNVITQASLDRTTSATGQKAIQAYFLVRHFPLLVGDKVPSENEYIQLIHLLLSCMDIIFSPRITVEETFLLSHLIQDHHEHFLTVFPENHLLPKHHHMLHYPASIRAIGPLMRFSCIRFEGKHNFFKQIAHITANYRNICKTMAQRHQMTLSDTLLNDELLKVKHIQTRKGSMRPLDVFQPHDEMIAEMMGVAANSEVFCARAVEFNGIEYRPGMMVALEIEEESGNPQYAKIQNVFVLDNATVYLLLHVWETLWFEEHYHAYAIQDTLTAGNTKCVTCHELQDYHPFHAINSFDEQDTCLYIVPRHR